MNVEKLKNFCEKKNISCEKFTSEFINEQIQFFEEISDDFFESIIQYVYGSGAGWIDIPFDEMFEMAPRLETDITVYRGAIADKLVHYKKTGCKVLESGQEICNMSTTIKRDVAETFVKISKENALLFVINITKGTEVIYVPAILKATDRLVRFLLNYEDPRDVKKIMYAIGTQWEVIIPPNRILYPEKIENDVIYAELT